MEDTDLRRQRVIESLDKIQKQVEECNPTPLEHDIGSIPEQNLLHNYKSAALQLRDLRKGLDSMRPGIFTSKREKESYNFEEEQYLALRSRHDKLGKDFSKNCICAKSPGQENP
jgi:hypothetical protein